MPSQSAGRRTAAYCEKHDAYGYLQRRLDMRRNIGGARDTLGHLSLKKGECQREAEEKRKTKCTLSKFGCGESNPDLLRVKEPINNT
jgi:hypothetical protein